MGHTHTHERDAASSGRTRLLLAAALVPFLLATIVGLVALWPSRYHGAPNVYPGVVSSDERAKVTRVVSSTCGGETRCDDVTISLETGPERGHHAVLPKMSLGPGVPSLRVGDEIVVSRLEVTAQGDVSYSFEDYQRTQPLWILAAIFSVLVVAVARWRGLGAIAGLGVTYLVLIRFVVPAILAGENALVTALVGSWVIVFVVLYLAHGATTRTSTALLGTLLSLGLTGLLAWFFVGATHLTGAASEEATYIQSLGLDISLSDLLLAGIVIGSLGVLNDVTVTQASAVWEIHRANPASRVRDVYRGGMRVGRDHIASTVYTLVLAYAGASLPLILLFTIGDRTLSGVLTSEVVASEIVRTLIGSIGLVASVPLTTFVASAVVTAGLDRPVSAPATRVAQALGIGDETA